MMKHLYILFAFLGCSAELIAQQKDSLTVEKIMRDERWVGTSPAQVQWDMASKKIYFSWNPAKAQRPSVFFATTEDPKPVRNTAPEYMTLSKRLLNFSRDRSNVLFEREGDIVLADLRSGKVLRITSTTEQETDPVFNKGEDKVIFRRNDNLYCVSVPGGEITQLTNFVQAGKETAGVLNSQALWLQEKQLATFDIVRSRAEERARLQKQKRTYPKVFNLSEGSAVREMSISPDMRFVVFNVMQPAGPVRNIVVPDYVTKSGYTEPVPGRTKVGGAQPSQQNYLYDSATDSTYAILMGQLPGIKDIPEYLKEYPSEYEAFKARNEDRAVEVTGFLWNPAGTLVLLNIMSADHKDRWIMKFDPLRRSLSLVDRQHDEAWVAGPGIGRGVNMGWINDEVCYFQSEATGYSHLYTVNVVLNSKKQLTSGNYEVQTLQLSNDKHYFYFTANLQDPGIVHFYRIPVNGGTPEKLTTMDGGNEVLLSPDEKWLAIRHSYINKPWELYLQKNVPNAKPVKVTQSTTPEFDRYPWRIPETITFKNRHGVDVHAQVFKPEAAKMNKAAVVFVHSNGYLQNVHYGWSYHYREYMFNNLLTDLGYTVINIDYTASSGYGRDFRTGIYRHMGGTDLTDLADGAKLLVDKYNIDPERIGLYGGSYGGFLTLMALFTEADVFKSGAALRSVTDWSNYNGRYTSSILNEPVYDEKAYRQSSPLFFAGGLKGNLLMTHGIVDMNVNFQDIVLLSQKLIELGKDNWELAVYPLEDHDFADAVSWTDQYKRILKLFKGL